MDTQYTSVPLPLFPHMLFMDRYYIIGEVGSGGFGSVYKAKDTRNGDALVAIKEVNLTNLPSRTRMEATSAFEREASLLSQLTHPNLPRLYEYFQRPEHWYLVMDFIVGETLDEYQSKAPRQRLLLSDALDIGMQLCTVLHYLHSQQPPIIFRDLKPANIIRAPTGKIYLIDFGIARYFKPGQPKDTSGPRLARLRRAGAVWQSANHPARRYLQPGSRFTSTAYHQRPLRSAVSLYTPSSQKPSEPL